MANDENAHVFWAVTLWAHIDGPGGLDFSEPVSLHCLPPQGPDNLLNLGFLILDLLQGHEKELDLFRPGIRSLRASALPGPAH